MSEQATARNDRNELGHDTVQQIGQGLQKTFDEWEKERREYEEQWIKDLRQYRGEHEPDILDKIASNRSAAFLNLTRVKVRTMDARMLDMLFPAGRSKNWTIGPTPNPDVDPVTKKMVAQALTEAFTSAAEAQGLDPQQAMDGVTEEEIDKGVAKIVKEACKSMEKTIEDQLLQGKYKRKCRKVFHSGHVFGTGILKGVSLDERPVRRYREDPQNPGEFSKVQRTKDLPYFENVRIWDWYPDMSAVDVESMEGSFLRHVLNKGQVRKLSRRPDFDTDRIESYLAEHPKGNAKLRNWEQDVKDLNDKLAAVQTHKRKYEVLEYTGYMDGQDLIDCGCDLKEGEEKLEFMANVWLLGNEVVKADLKPADTDPGYFLYHYEVDDTSLYGIGIPEITAETQEIVNSVNRATMDNAALSVGPIGEVNMELLEPGENPEDLTPLKLFKRKGRGQEATVPAIKWQVIPNNTANFRLLTQDFKEFNDEISNIPSYMHGNGDQGGAGKTARGLSMLMGAASLQVKDAVDNFDEGVTKPFIEAMYDWNMDPEFNPDPRVKGDFAVSAVGTASLVAREIRTEQIVKFADMTSNPQDQMYVDRYALIKELAQLLEIPEDIVRDEDGVEHVQQLEDKAQALMQKLGDIYQAYPDIAAADHEFIESMKPEAA